MNETMVTVTGNIAGEVTARRVGEDERLVVSFRVASSERRWDKLSGDWIDGDRFSASVSCWRRLAEGVRGSLVKGDPVVVTGRLSVREYLSEGERRFSTEIAAVAVGPDLARSSAQVTRRRPAAVDGEVVRTGDGAAPDPFVAVVEGSDPAEEIPATSPFVSSRRDSAPLAPDPEDDLGEDDLPPALRASA